MPNGTLFTEDFLREGIDACQPWQEIDERTLEEFRAALTQVLASVARPALLNEAQTEERIVRPILSRLGWQDTFSVQAVIGRRGRANVPDYTLFATSEAFRKADEASDRDAALRHAVAVGDAKAWSIDLDQHEGGAGKGETPAAQALRYLNRAEVVSDRAVRFAVLTNGRRWRLYFSGAKSLLDDYYEIDLAWVLGLPGTQGTLGTSPAPTDAAAERRSLKTFLLVFGRQSFLPSSALGGKSFHDYAFEAGRLWEAKVRSDLSTVVFQTVFPGLVRALAAADRDAPRAADATYLAGVGEAALALLYRLLFVLYAEDRDLLPPADPRYDDYSMSRLRDGLARRIDADDTFSGRADTLWRSCATLFRIVDEGDSELGVPPYNGGLFSRERAPLLDRAPIPDATFAPLLDRLSRTLKDGRLVRINFRDLSVRELGAIYEGLLEYEPVPDADEPGGIGIRLNPFSRKNTGSYYTPDELVSLVVERTISPLVEERLKAFVDKAAALGQETRPVGERLADLELFDPASRILDLKVCDPAMGSGHFLVSLIDYLAEKVFTATGQAAAAVEWMPGGYASPLLARLRAIRDRITAEATANKWTVRDEQLSDQNLVKRMVLKRCVYGVDKNPMAVELAKVSLWLHTFTAGAPLSFLDHHLQCGDSLFGERVRGALDDLARRGAVLINDAIRRAEAGVTAMERIENLTDAEVAEVKASELAYADVERQTAPLKRFLDVWQALKWDPPSPKVPKGAMPTPAQSRAIEDARALDALLDGQFGDPVRVAAGLDAPRPPGRGVASAEEGPARDYHAVIRLLARARASAASERFLHWEVAFPGVWRNWQSTEPEGGFDAVIGNPPWDRMKMQEVEWFAARAPTIARQARAADRKAMIARLKTDGDPLAEAYATASRQAEAAMRRSRSSGDYPLLGGGDVNLYSLFVERAQRLIRPDGVAGLLTPSGIASDLGASTFFKGVAATGRLLSLLDFENRRGEGRNAFFPDVDSRFKFCAFVAGGARRRAEAAECAFFLRDRPEAAAPEQVFRLTAADFALVNPNTGTAPIFRTRRDADLTTAIYARLPVLVDRSSGREITAWPVRYLRMFDMTNDSTLFWDRKRLDAHGAYRVEGGRWRKADEEWVPLYEGKMVQAFDHRAADVLVNANNLHRPAQPRPLDASDHADPKRTATPQYWVQRGEIDPFALPSAVVGFKEITAPTNERGMIAALCPTTAAFGNTLPLVFGRRHRPLRTRYCGRRISMHSRSTMSPARKFRGSTSTGSSSSNFPLCRPFSTSAPSDRAPRAISCAITCFGSPTPLTICGLSRATWATRVDPSVGKRPNGVNCVHGSTLSTSTCTA